MGKKITESESERVRRVLNEYLDRLAELRKEHDQLLKEFIRALEAEKERQLRSGLT